MLANVKVRLPTFTTIDVPNTGILVLPENIRRFFALLQNTSNTDMWIMYGSVPAVGQGILVPKSGFSFEIDRSNLWQYEVYAIHGGSGTKTMAVLDCH